MKHPDQRVGILIDVQNLYHSAKHLFGAKVNFKKVVEVVLAGRKLIRAIAYDVEVDTKEKEAFLTALAKSGIEIRSKPLQEFAGGMKKGDWDVGLAVEAIKLSRALDAIVLVTGDGDFVPLARYLQETSGALIEAAAFRRSTSSALIAEVDDFIDLSAVEGVLIKVGEGRRLRERAAADEAASK